MGSSWYTLVVDARDPARLARWWGEVLGYELVYEEAAYSVIGVDKSQRPGICFVRVPDVKGVKNRMHIDLDPDDLDAEVERLVDMGARHVDIGQREVPWVVLADPEGNEFCVLNTRE